MKNLGKSEYVEGTSRPPSHMDKAKMSPPCSENQLRFHKHADSRAIVECHFAKVEGEVAVASFAVQCPRSYWPTTS